jgi:hypothetical protein
MRLECLAALSAFQALSFRYRAHPVFSIYNDRGECENRIEEFKNGLPLTA